ncbi:MAG TPA: chemotaxis response regulator protein-glutamate methylesterase [Acidobacteriaceae bacterium]|nr:chemotaxis response regulator protein-glutamate methylesterase [Acidobacteriaceae bacterium]
MLALDSKIRVLIVDDSAIVRKYLTEAIAAQSDMEVVGTAPDAYIAREKVRALRPDVLTLDIEMPRMDGITFLRRLMQEQPVPTIIVSSLGQDSCAATFEALRCGAVDVVAKPASPQALRDLDLFLAAKIRGAAGARPRPARDLHIAAPSASRPSTNTAPPESTRLSIQPVVSSTSSLGPAIIAIGASTGGTAAIQEVLLRLPPDIPPIVITQHIPPGFSGAFAERLNRICALEVREAVHGDRLRRGLVLLAPGDHHMVVCSTPGGFTVELEHGPEVCYLRPSVDVMFFSVAEAIGSRAVGVLLTGMGADGARGMLALHQAGAATIAQDEATCVVYGMPREAARLNAVDTIAPLAVIPTLLTRLTRPPHPVESSGRGRSRSTPHSQEIHP